MQDLMCSPLNYSWFFLYLKIGLDCQRNSLMLLQSHCLEKKMPTWMKFSLSIEKMNLGEAQTLKENKTMSQWADITPKCHLVYHSLLMRGYRHVIHHEACELQTYRMIYPPLKFFSKRQKCGLISKTLGSVSLFLSREHQILYKRLN